MAASRTSSGEVDSHAGLLAPLPIKAEEQSLLLAHVRGHSAPTSHALYRSPSDPKTDATGAGGRAGASSNCSPSHCGTGKEDLQGEGETGSSAVPYCKTGRRGTVGLGSSCSLVTRVVTIPVDEEMLAREKRKGLSQGGGLVTKSFQTSI